MKEAKGITDEQVEAIFAKDVRERGALNWEWVQAILKAIDQHVPGASGASIALATRDVYQYLKNPGIRDTIETGVRQAMQPGVPTVVVSHSLGTVVAYNLLRREGVAAGWKVPLFITLGSPLAVKVIRSALSPIDTQRALRAGSTQWMNVTLWRCTRSLQVTSMSRLRSRTRPTSETTLATTTGYPGTLTTLKWHDAFTWRYPRTYSHDELGYVRLSPKMARSWR